MSTKYCYSCKETKPVTQFSKDKSTKDGFSDKCKSCKKIGIRKTRDKKIIFSLDYKGGKCLDCEKSLSFPEDKGEYNFHHTDPSTKVSKMNQLFKDKAANHRLVQELDKCVLLCKPCHIKRHKDYNAGLRPTL